MKLSDETLMAFADGELDPAEVAAVAMAVQADPALAAKVAVFRQSRAAVAQAFAGPAAAAPDPDPIAERIRSLAAGRAAPPAPDNVVALPSRRQVPFWQVPLAAAVMLAVGLAAGTLAFRTPGPVGGLASAILDDPGLSPALASLPSGSRQGLASGAEVALIATFRNGDGVLCREFEYDLPSGLTTVAVACRAEAGWDVQLAIAADAGASGYAPASSLEALDAWLLATGTEPPMSLADEGAALAAAP
jgi:hypothetical protein